MGEKRQMLKQLIIKQTNYKKKSIIIIINYTCCMKSQEYLHVKIIIKKKLD
jgi:hypothetical protein